ncbi:hypothetical protein ACI2JA_03185 [Alkalihalobacillus sp. NPDC078783]
MGFRRQLKKETGNFDIKSNPTLFGEWQEVDSEVKLGKWAVPYLTEFANVVKNDKIISVEQLKDWCRSVEDFQMTFHPLAFHPYAKDLTEEKRFVIRKITDLKRRTVNYIESKYIEEYKTSNDLMEAAKKLPYTLTFTYGRNKKSKSFISFLSNLEKEKLVEEFKENRTLSLSVVNPELLGVYSDVQYLTVSRIEEVIPRPKNMKKASLKG